MSGPFNLAQLAGTGLKDWKSSNRPAGEAPPPLEHPVHAVIQVSDLAIIQPEEKSTMTFRSDIRAAIADAGTMTYADLEKRFADKEVSGPLSQMTTAGQLKRKGSGKEAVYSIGGVGGRKTAAAAGTGKRTGKGKAAKRSSPKPRAIALPRLVRGDPIAVTIAELQRRREGIDQAIAVLEALA